VSFVIPTFNAAKTLGICLESVFRQDYPWERVEVLIVDGGSTDETLAIARKFQCRFLTNPIRFEDGPGAGKDIGFRHASGDIVVFLDSDNELASARWLRNMVAPYLSRPNVVGTFSHLIPKSDGGLLSRYLTKTHSQPAIRFWQPNDVVRLPEDDSQFRLIRLNAACDLSNGASARRECLYAVGGYDYGFETTKRLMDAGYTTFAWPRGVEVYHHYTGVTLRNLVRKRIARLRRFKTWQKEGLRNYTTSVYKPRSGDDYVQFCARVLKSLSFMTLPEAAWRSARERDGAWLYHPLVSFIDTNLHIIFLWDVGLRALGLKRGSGGT
jgi:glycosyltransferase involved in cell wall biosynthesis